MAQRDKRPSFLKISYDHRTDTLYLLQGSQRGSVARDIGHGILIKYNRATHKPIGAIVHDFEEHFKKESKAFKLPELAFAG